MARTQTDLRPEKSSAAHGPLVRLRGAGFSMLLMLFIYLCTVYVPIGWITYGLTVPPLLIIMVTAVARINDMSMEMMSTLWKVRRNGLILTFTFALAQLIAPVFSGATEDWPTWRTVIGVWGFALVWMTTPHLPPWKKYIWDRYSAPEHQHPHRRKSDDFDTNP